LNETIERIYREWDFTVNGMVTRGKTQPGGWHARTQPVVRRGR
jgi:hypothetical protein